MVRYSSRRAGEIDRLSFQRERPAMAPLAPLAIAVRTWVMKVSWSTPAESTAHGTPAAAAVTAAHPSAEPGYCSFSTFAPHSTASRAPSATSPGNAAR